MEMIAKVNNKDIYRIAEVEEALRKEHLDRRSGQIVYYYNNRKDSEVVQFIIEDVILKYKNKEEVEASHATLVTIKYGVYYRIKEVADTKNTYIISPHKILRYIF